MKKLSQLMKKMIAVVCLAALFLTNVPSDSLTGTGDPVHSDYPISTMSDDSSYDIFEY